MHVASSTLWVAGHNIVQVGGATIVRGTQVQVAGSTLMVAMQTMSQVIGTQVQVTGSGLMVAIQTILQAIGGVH